jgi:CRISPR system Cascade subunit CasE
MSFRTIATVDTSRIDVARDIADRDRMHKRLMSLYPDGLGSSPRKKINLLFTVDAPSSTVIFQADMPPVVGPLNDARNQYFTSVDTTEVSTEVVEGDTVKFQLVLAGLIRHSGTGKRTTVLDNKVMIAKARGSLGKNGLNASNIECIGTDEVVSEKRGIHYYNYHLVGEATVTDADAVATAVRQGLGAGRLWGSAMLFVSSV